MIKVLFICHGNICRSPMAEFVLKEMVKEKGIEGNFYIESAAISYEEIGNPVYPPVKRLLESLGIDCSNKHARIMTKNDYEEFDYILGMDISNIYGIKRIIGEDSSNKVHLLMEYTGENTEVSDPWYTRDFNEAYNDIYRGCKAFLESI